MAGMKESIRDKTSMADNPPRPRGPTGSSKGYGPVKPISATGAVQAGDKPVPTTA